MNAVEAAQQLMQVGRQMQALEQRLRMPLAALYVDEKWRELLVDPGTRFAELLAMYDSPPPAAQSSDPAHPVASFPWQNAPEITSTPAIEWERPDGQIAATPMVKPAPHADVLPVASTLDHPQPPSSSPTSRRLTRDRSSLLSILNANLQADTQSRSSIAGTEAVPLSSSRYQLHQPQALSRPQLGTHAISGQVDRPHTHPADDQPDAGRLLVEPVHRPAEMGSSALAATTLRQSGQRTEPSSSSTQHPLDFRPVSDEAQALRHEPREANDFQPVADEVGRGWTQGKVMPNASQPRPVPSAEAYSVSDRPPVVEDDPNWPAATSATPPLSSAQIDQILDALDERLELMLLRMYGTAGG